MTARLRNRTRLFAAGAAFLALFTLGCDTDSPTQPGHPPETGGNAGGTWVVTITAADTTLDTGEQTSLVVSIRRAEDGTPPPEGALTVISTDLGAFNEAGTQTARQLELNEDGDAAAEFFPGDTAGTATITAQIESHEGFLTIKIRDDRFATSITIEATPSTLFEGEDGVVELLAEVVDNFGDAIKGAVVNFSAVLGVLDSAGEGVETGKAGRSRDTLRLTAEELQAFANNQFQVQASLVLEDGTLETVNEQIAIQRFKVPDTIELETQGILPENGGTITLEAMVFDSEALPLAGAQVQFMSPFGVLGTDEFVETGKAGRATTTLKLGPKELDDIQGRTFQVSARVVTGQGTFKTANATANIERPKTVVLAVDPASGSFVGGYDVEIFGDGFIGPLRVFFGGKPSVEGSVPAEIVSASKTVCTVTVPPRPDGAPTEAEHINVVVVSRFMTANEAEVELVKGFAWLP